MELNLLSASVATVFLLVVAFFLVQSMLIPELTRAKKGDEVDLNGKWLEPSMLTKSLKSALPDNIVLPSDSGAFRQSMNAYWAQQECEVVPACVVQPRDTQHLSTAVKILKGEYDERQSQDEKRNSDGLFAVRGGGHSPVPGAASISGGVVVDLSHFREVSLSENESFVVIGAGAKWMDVSKVLDPKGLAIVGGRNSAVGVGGLTLGGKSSLQRNSIFLPSDQRAKVGFGQKMLGLIQKCK